MKTLPVFLLILTGIYAHTQTVSINNAKPRYDADGNIVDAHDGRIIQFGNKYYWYGTAYGNTNGLIQD